MRTCSCQCHCHSQAGTPVRGGGGGGGGGGEDVTPVPKPVRQTSQADRDQLILLRRSLKAPVASTLLVPTMGGGGGISSTKAIICLASSTYKWVIPLMREDDITSITEICREILRRNTGTEPYHLGDSAMAWLNYTDPNIPHPLSAETYEYLAATIGMFSNTPTYTFLDLIEEVMGLGLRIMFHDWLCQLSRFASPVPSSITGEAFGSNPYGFSR